MWRALVESSLDLITVTEPDGTIIYSSPSVKRLRGYDPDWIVGKNAFDFIHPDDLPEVGESVTRMMDGSRHPVVKEFRIRHADGSWRVFEGIATLFHLDRHGPAIIINSRDITDRKHAQEALAESQERWRSLVESAPSIILTVDREGTILYTNYVMAGMTTEEALGANAAGFVDPADREQYSQVLEHVFETGQSASMEVRGGGPVAGTHWHSTFGPVRRDGETVATIIVTTDITERKSMEEKIRFQANLLDTVGQAVIVTDISGNVTYWNRHAEKLYGWAAEDAIGRSILKLTSAEELTERAAEIMATLRSGETWSGEFLVRSKDGTTFPAIVSNAPVYDEDGRMAGVVGISTDISDLKKVQDQLQKERQRVEKLNRSLDNKVKRRTRQLERAVEKLRERNELLIRARAEAATDALTGLPNHRAFQDRILEEFQRAESNQGTVSLIMLDIDRFKVVNDTLGHGAGDQLLVDVAAILTEAVGSDNAFRYGGDEFAVVLRDEDETAALAVAEDVRSSVQKHLAGKDQAVREVTVSLGVATYPTSAGTRDELVYGADSAMYWAKSAGRNRAERWKSIPMGTPNQPATAVTRPDSCDWGDLTVRSLMTTLTAKDPSTSSHASRCSWYASDLAEELGLDETEKATIRLAALLHDIGKLAVPDNVLLKPGPLDDEEWKQMRTHPVAGAEIVRQVVAPAAAQAVLHHHEHFDGSGYPDGLSGDRIPMAARILLVTDAFDAMTTDRPYRNAMPIEAAVKELESFTGTQFDPNIVEAFLRLLKRNGYSCPHTH